LFFIGVAKLNFLRIGQFLIALRQASQLVYSALSRGTESCVNAAMARWWGGGVMGMMAEMEIVILGTHKIYI
jgi:hypothetical protein